MMIHETWNFLHDTILPAIEGKISSKRIVKYIKEHLGHRNLQVKQQDSAILSDDEEEGFYTDDSSHSNSDPYLSHTHTKDSSFADSTINDIDLLRLAASEALLNGGVASRIGGGQGTDSPAPSESPTPLPSGLRARSRSASEIPDGTRGLALNGRSALKNGALPGHIREDLTLAHSMSDGYLDDDAVVDVAEVLQMASKDPEAVGEGEANWLADGLAIVNGWLTQVEVSGETNERNFLAVLKRWIGWLQMPVVEEGVKPTLAEIRERNLVRQRRFVLTCATAYAFLIRYVSFDFFIFILIASNFVLLYAIKNSRKINVRMAKRTVKQRVGWAKQYLGGILRTKKSGGGVGEVGEGDREMSGSPVPGSVVGAVAGTSVGGSKSVSRRRLGLTLRARRSMSGVEKSGDDLGHQKEVSTPTYEPDTTRGTSVSVVVYGVVAFYTPNIHKNQTWVLLARTDG
ncbi:hypothetical protein HDV00_008687 [Rhizophlyctis rosea]|nr:hypothetical protein HDV00_008687 [Rhizophlyctis rosea]